MSIESYEEIQCPRCDNNFQIRTWDTINATLDPDLREELICGRLLIADCPKCGETIKLKKSFLYHDMEREFLVYYFPFESTNDSEFFDNFSKDGRVNANSGMSEEDMPEYAQTIHYVFSMNELVRYILFREKLADIKNAAGR